MAVLETRAREIATELGVESRGCQDTHFKAK